MFHGRNVNIDVHTTLGEVYSYFEEDWCLHHSSNMLIIGKETKDGYEIHATFNMQYVVSFSIDEIEE